MHDLWPLYLRWCVAPTRKRPRQTAGSGRAACTLPRRVRTCGGTGPAGPTAETGGRSGPSAPTGPGTSRCLRRPWWKHGGWGCWAEQREAAGASFSHQGSTCSLTSDIFTCDYSSSVLLLLIRPCFVLHSWFFPFSRFLFSLDYSFSSLYLL